MFFILRIKKILFSLQNPTNDFYYFIFYFILNFIIIFLLITYFIFYIKNLFYDWLKNLFKNFFIIYLKIISINSSQNFFKKILEIEFLFKTTQINKIKYLNTY